MEKKRNMDQGFDWKKKKSGGASEGSTLVKTSSTPSYAAGRDSLPTTTPYAPGLQAGVSSQPKPEKTEQAREPEIPKENETPPYVMGRDEWEPPTIPYAAGLQGGVKPLPTVQKPTVPRGGTEQDPYIAGRDEVKTGLPYAAGSQAGIKPGSSSKNEQSGSWRKKKAPKRAAQKVLEELEMLERSYDDMLREAEAWESQATLQETPEEMSQWEKKSRNLRKKAAELEPYLDTLQKEWEYAMNWEWEKKKKEEGYRDPTLRDLTVGSFWQGYDTAQFGKESYRDMLGEEDNRKAELEEKLAGEEYKFMPEEWWQKGLSGISSEGGELLNKAVDPDTLSIVGATTLATSAGGVTAPVGLAVGSTAANAWNDIKIETGLTYDELLKNGVSEETARPIAEMVGGAAGLLGVIPVDSLMESLGILQKGGVSQKAVEIILDELKRRGIIVAGEMLLDTAQEGLTIAGVQAGTKIDTGEWAYNGKQVTDQLSNTMVNSAIKNGFLEIPGMVKSVVTEAGKSSQGVSDALVSDQTAALMLGDQRTKEFLVRKGHLILTKDMSESQKIAAVKKAVEAVIRKHQNQP